MENISSRSEIQGAKPSQQDKTVQEIIIFSTGGTIDKIYNEGTGNLENRGPIIERQLLDLLRLPYSKLDLIPIMSKDSLYMDQNDRVKILETIKFHQPRAVPMIVLHGTDTMEHTARYCQENLANLRSPVIFTGAMKPFGFSDSDAIQNVTEALIAAKLLNPGVYISFHSRIFDAMHVRKNKDIMTFESHNSFPTEKASEHL